MDYAYIILIFARNKGALTSAVVRFAPAQSNHALK